MDRPVSRLRYTLLALLWTPPRGDASVILVHQLIAAKLNVANGSDVTPIAPTLAAADALLAAHAGELPYGVRSSAPEGRSMTAAAETLDAFNNRQLTPGCNAGPPAGNPKESDDEDARGDSRTDPGTGIPNPAPAPANPLPLGAWILIVAADLALIVSRPPTKPGKM